MDVLLETVMIFLWKIVVSVVSDHSTISVRIIRKVISEMFIVV